MKAYLVRVSDKTANQFIFVTTHRAKAEYWVERFNRIVEENRERITLNHISGVNCLWRVKVVCDPIAAITEIELR